MFYTKNKPQVVKYMRKLSTLLKTWPNGTVALQPWLQEQGVYRQLSQKYVLGGWVNKVGTGAFVRAGDKVHWQGGVYALQKELHLPLHVGGLSSLELLGSAHFIPMGTPLHLYIYIHGKGPQVFPKWFSYFNQVQIVYLTQRLFRTVVGLQEYDCDAFTINIASRERAILEVLSLVPTQFSFEHSWLLVQGLATLRPELTQELLEQCRSYIAVRLFLYLAKKAQLPMFERLQIERLDLGVGYRKVGTGEEFSPEFKLYVPKLKLEGSDENAAV